MILFILLALLIAKARREQVCVVFKEYSMIPVWMAEILFWCFQICAWIGDYRFVRFASLIQSFYILTLICPILKFGLYRRAVIGAVLTGAGSFLNRIVMDANGGQMPVHPSISKLTGYFKEGAIEAAQDARHVLMSQSTKLSFLGDYIDVGFSIMSPGDILIHLFVTLIIYGVIKELNRKGIAD